MLSTVRLQTLSPLCANRSQIQTKTVLYNTLSTYQCPFLLPIPPSNIVARPIYLYRVVILFIGSWAHYKLTWFLPGDANPEEDVRMRKRRRGLLRMYYGVDDQVPEQEANPMDIDHAQFRSDMFMEKVLKECSLNELYHMEGKMKKGRCWAVHVWWSKPRTYWGGGDL